MKTVSIIGIGMSRETVTAQGLAAVKAADVLLGAPRMTDAFADLGKPSIPEYAAARVAQAVRGSDRERFAVLVSGDVGFYSAAESLLRALDFCEVGLIPGVSSLGYFFAKLRLPWQDAAAISCHGREQNLADTVRRNRFTFALTGGNVPALAEALESADFGGLTVTVGENLGRPEERIFSRTARELKAEAVSSLAVLLVENPQADASVPCGIADERFIRGEVPMTKAEVRAAIASKLRIAPDMICADVGAGTGSVTVETALAAWRGHVYAIDRVPEAVELIGQNARRFHLGNVTPILGRAPEALEDLPPLDAVFIGGSSGGMDQIVAAVLKKNLEARIVASAIALESAMNAVRALSDAGLSPEVVQIAASRSRAVAGLHMMMALNPIYLISGGGKACPTES